MSFRDNELDAQDVSEELFDEFIEELTGSDIPEELWDEMMKEYNDNETAQGQKIAAIIFDLYMARSILELFNPKLDDEYSLKNATLIREYVEKEKAIISNCQMFQKHSPFVDDPIIKSINKGPGFLDIKRYLEDDECAFPYTRVLTNNNQRLIPNVSNAYLSARVLSYLICYFLTALQECLDVLFTNDKQLFNILKYTTIYFSPYLEADYINNDAIALSSIAVYRQRLDELVNSTLIDQYIDVIAYQEAKRNIEQLLSLTGESDNKRNAVISFTIFYIKTLILHMEAKTVKEVYDYFESKVSSNNYDCSTTVIDKFRKEILPLIINSQSTNNQNSRI